MTQARVDRPNHRWLRTLLSGKPHFVIGSGENPYLLRWFLIPRNTKLNIYLHKFLQSDDDRALHDHPWWFFSFIIRGGYHEETPNGEELRMAPSVAFRPATHVHRVQLIDVKGGGELPTWTIIVTGPKIRHWGFWCTKGFRVWEEFDEKGCE